MPYVEEFKNRLNQGDINRVLQLWEEYTHADEVPSHELVGILKLIKASDLSKEFGRQIELFIPLWEKFQDPEDSYAVLRELIDLQTTNAPELADLAMQALKTRYGNEPHFDLRLRLVGLRSVEGFQGALSHFDLLSHMAKGKFVFHTGGWGTGEIMDISLVREQLVIEFENISGTRDVSFANAFKTLLPLSDDHFLARRFGNPDQLEQAARDNPQEVIRALLRDLGPKTASEIKDEMAEWVIPEKEWTKWWQATRARLKKDTFIESPDSVKEPFRLREESLSHEKRFLKDFEKTKSPHDTILTAYNFVRDFPEHLKDDELKQTIEKKLYQLLEESLSPEQEIQVVIFLEDLLGHDLKERPIQKLIQALPDKKEIIEAVPILSFKKRLLIAIRKYCNDWVDIFLTLLGSVQQGALKEYIFGELSQKESLPRLQIFLKRLLEHPAEYPDLFFWYFQKERTKETLEALFVLLHKIENDPAYRDLTKKIINLLIAKRYELIRQMIQGTTLSYLKEFLLLASKCHSFSEQDLKTLRSLAAVVQPSLASDKEEIVEQVVWTTAEGYKKVRDRIEKIATVEMVENAREIETARAHGDLRENAEYKAAQERRSRLQSEMRSLSHSLNHARVLTKDDIIPGEVCPGTIVEMVNPKGEKVVYTILGPWDANPEANILSFQSKLAEAMIGCKVGEEFSFKGESYQVISIKPWE